MTLILEHEELPQEREREREREKEEEGLRVRVGLILALGHNGYAMPHFRALLTFLRLYHQPYYQPNDAFTRRRSSRLLLKAGKGLAMT